MKQTVTLVVFLLLSVSLYAQSISLPPSGDNQKCSVTQWIGPVTVTLSYSSPDIHGPAGEDRTGHIWGELVPYGFTDPQYGTSMSAPWRAGANENSTIEFSHDVVIDGNDIKAGKYGIFLDVQKEGPWTWILSTDANNWGHYHYDPKNDAIRVKAAAKEAPFTEWLTFGFDDRKPTSAVAYLQWEKKRVDLKIEAKDVDKIYVDNIRADLQGHRMGFTNQSWMDAAQFCAERKINLDEALEWADYAISGRYIGKEDFNSLQTKAIVLEAMGKDADAESIMKKAINHPTATVQSVHQYGRTLLQNGKKDKALEVFKMNRQKHPEDKFTTYVGLARGYTAVGDKKNAIKNWEMAIKNLPEDQKANKAFYEGELQKLKSSKA
jgi:tetratricopeptide (TPR) repeat protein